MCLSFYINDLKMEYNVTYILLHRQTAKPKHSTVYYNVPFAWPALTGELSLMQQSVYLCVRVNETNVCKMKYG